MFNKVSILTLAVFTTFNTTFSGDRTEFGPLVDLAKIDFAPLVCARNVSPSSDSTAMTGDRTPSPFFSPTGTRMLSSAVLTPTQRPYNSSCTRKRVSLAGINTIRAHLGCRPKLSPMLIEEIQAAIDAAQATVVYNNQPDSALRAVTPKD